MGGPTPSVVGAEDEAGHASSNASHERSQKRKKKKDKKEQDAGAGASSAREHDTQRGVEKQQTAMERALDMFGADSESEHDAEGTASPTSNQAQQTPKNSGSEGRMDNSMGGPTPSVIGAEDEAGHASSSASHERSLKKKK